MEYNGQTIEKNLWLIQKEQGFNFKKKYIKTLFYIIIALIPIFILGCGKKLSYIERLNSKNNSSKTSIKREKPNNVMHFKENIKNKKQENKKKNGQDRDSQLFYGSGEFINRSKSKDSNSVNIEEEGGVTLNFRQADIKKVVQTILGDILGKNFTIGPKLRGKVTFHTEDPLPKDKIIPALESVLRMHGAALIKKDDLYQIKPLQEAARGMLPPTLPGPERSGFQVLVLPLEYIDAKKAHNLLKPFLPREAVVNVNKARNLLIIAGTSEQLRGLQRTVELFDVNWLEGMSMGIIPIQNAKPKPLSAKLRQLFGKNGETPIAGMLRFIPLQRLQAIMIITQQKDYLTQAKDWIERLDRIGAGREGKQLFVYQVQSGKATHLAEILSRALGGKAQTERLGISEGEVTPGEEEVTVTTESHPVQGTSKSASRGMGSPDVQNPNARSANVQDTPGNLNPDTGKSAQIENRGQPTENSGTLSEQNGQYRDRPAGASYDAGETNQGFQVGGTRVIADQANNALLILATKEKYQLIRSTLETLDTTPRQVLVQATIAEVTLTGELRYGIQWFLENNDIQIDGSDLTGQARVDFDQGANISSQIASGFSYSLVDTAGQVRALLEALARDSLIQVLSSPSIMVLNNREASIRVGDEIPIQTGSTTTSGGNVTRSFQFRDTGVILEVTPRINAGGLISMELSQEVTDVGQLVDFGDAQQFRFNQRTIQSNVAVQSGETIVLGGLIRDKNRKNRSGVPFLSRIPLLGALFGIRAKETERRELVVLITPKVLNRAQTSAPVIQEIRRKMNNLFPLPEAHNHHIKRTR